MWVSAQRWREHADACKSYAAHWRAMAGDETDAKRHALYLKYADDNESQAAFALDCARREDERNADEAEADLDAA